ncbi:hypothetical protein LCGC14_0905110 [marine sediment metagenome]|uniref:PglD N-terminal domain-containing protein n=1 Tax=marine sediment metagenome TaxID=412755 RepID=A0A0F9NZX9_9ZZZZ
MARTVILGNGGYAKILACQARGECLDKDDPIPDDADILIGVGDKDKRRELYLKHRGRVVGTVADTANFVAMNHGDGLHLMAGAIIQPGCAIGENVLINFGALIDHDCNIGDHCVISPGAILCGSVTLGEGCFVGAGAIIIQEVTLPDETFVPAGTLVVGPDDFRKPVRDVRGSRAAKALGLEDTVLLEEHTFEKRVEHSPD